MEPIGLAVGVVGLAGLFEACIAAFDRVDVYRQYGSTERQLQNRFENQKFLLEDWGARAGIAVHSKQSPKSPQIDTTLEGRRNHRIKETLTCIYESLEAINRHFRHHGHAVTPALFLPMGGNTGAAKPSPLSKLKWATGGKQRLVEQVDWFENMVKTLGDLIDGSMPSATMEQGRAPPSAAAVQSLKAWLDATSSRAVLEQCTSCRTDGTCEWISTRPEYMEWLKPETKNRTLWLHAPPGSGKSVTSAALIENLRREHPDNVLSYFCSAAQDELRVSTNILRSCLAQAVLQRPDLFRLAEESKNRSDSQIATETELLYLFSTMTKTEPGLIMLVDGFDECYEFESDFHQRCGSNRGSLLRQLRASVADTPSHLLILSRDEDDIRSALGRSKDPSIDNGVAEYRIHKEDIQADIERFAIHQVESLTGLSKRRGQLREEVTQHLSNESDGMFLWVRLQSMQLTQAMTVAQLRKQMEDVPSGLNQFYERDWQRIQSTDGFQRDRALLIIRWVTFAVRPLTAHELFEAIAVNADRTTSEPFEESLPDEVVSENLIQMDLLGPCKPFLTLQQDSDGSTVAGTIQLAHFSMKTFLLEKLIGKPCCTSAHVHDGTLATACIRYLSTGISWMKLDVLDDGLKGHPFLSYAVKNWMVHLDYDHNDYKDAMALTKDFFSQHNPHWDRWRDGFESLLEKENPAPVVEADRTVKPGGVCYYAASFGLLDVLKAHLAEKPGEMNNVGGRYGTALQAACVNGHHDVTSFLLDIGADVNTQAGLRGCALNAAAASDHKDLVSLLLQNQADCMLTDDLGRNALHTAASEGHASTLQRLIDAGCDLNQGDRSGCTPVNIASDNGHTKVVKLLLQAQANPSIADDEGFTPVFNASGMGHLQILQFLLAAGCDPNQSHDYGWTPVNAASLSGHTDVVELLLKAGANPDTADNKGFTPINAASLSGHTGVVELLLKAGANPNTVDNEGFTPVYCASRNGHLETLHPLISAGCNLDQCPQSGWTPVMISSARDHTKVVELLLDNGAEINIQGGDYGNALQAATCVGNTEIVRMLLDRGAEINAQGGTFGNALQAATCVGNTEIVRMLLDRGAEINAQGGTFGNALQAASLAGNTEIVRMLLDEGADINVQGGEHGNALQAASRGGHEEVVRLLLNSGANVKTQGLDDFYFKWICVATKARLAAQLYDEDAAALYIDLPDTSRVLSLLPKPPNQLSEPLHQVDGQDGQYSNHDAAAVAAAAAFMLEGTWSGYYLVFDSSDSIDPPMMNINFMTPPGQQHGGQTSEEWLLQADDCIDSIGDFNLSGKITQDEDPGTGQCIVAFHGRKSYSNRDPGLDWDWECRLTPFGLLGFWGKAEPEQPLRRHGMLWLWRQERTKRNEGQQQANIIPVLLHDHSYEEHDG